MYMKILPRGLNGGLLGLTRFVLDRASGDYGNEKWKFGLFFFSFSWVRV